MDLGIEQMMSVSTIFLPFISINMHWRQLMTVSHHSCIQVKEQERWMAKTPSPTSKSNWSPLSLCLSFSLSLFFPLSLSPLSLSLSFSLFPSSLLSPLPPFFSLHMKHTFIKWHLIRAIEEKIFKKLSWELSMGGEPVKYKMPSFHYCTFHRLIHLFWIC